MKHTILAFSIMEVIRRIVPNTMMLAMIFIMTLTISCTSGMNINGSNMETAHKSVLNIKYNLPVEQRMEFEISYWSLRDQTKTDEEFLDIVDGKSAEEMIVIGKKIFHVRKNDGFKEYKNYHSWDDMIHILGREIGQEYDY
jgi:hypothetical protein